MANHANNAAAVAAGWRRTQTDSGVAGPDRYRTEYSKPTVGQAGYGGGLLTATGVSSVDQATADTNALNALNEQRKHVYGGAGSNAGTSTKGSGARTFDE